jgi:hypothetical protein
MDIPEWLKGRRVYFTRMGVWPSGYITQVTIYPEEKPHELRGLTEPIEDWWDNWDEPTQQAIVQASLITQGLVGVPVHLSDKVEYLEGFIRIRERTEAPASPEVNHEPT